MPRIALLVLSLSLISAGAFAETLVYVAAGTANKVIVIDADSDLVVGEFTGILNPHSAVATPDGEFVISGSLKEMPPAKGETGPSESTIYLSHPLHGHVMMTIPADGMIHHQAITPDGRYVISTHPTKKNISIADLQTNSVVKTLATGSGPYLTLVTGDGGKAYVSNTGSGTISEIDTATWTIARDIDVGPGPEHMVFSKDEKTIFVVRPRSGTVASVSLPDGEVTRTFEVGKALHGLDISDNGGTLFITSVKEEKLIALDPVTGARREVALSPSPYHLETIHGTGKVYVSSSKASKIWSLDQETLEVLKEIEITGQGHQMAIVRD